MAYHRRRRRVISAISLLASSFTNPSRYTHIGNDQSLHEPENLPTVGDLRAAVHRSQQAGDTSSAAVDKAVDEASALVNRLRMYGKNLPGSPLHMDLERRRLLALMGSGAMENPFNLLLTYGANDYNWPELYFMIGALRRREEEYVQQQNVVRQQQGLEALPFTLGPEESDASKADRLHNLALNPYLATRHYFEREEALWKYILDGERKPLGEITDDWKRHGGFQRGSFHTHCLLATKVPEDVKRALAGTGDTEDDISADTSTLCDYFKR